LQGKARASQNAGQASVKDKLGRLGVHVDLISTGNVGHWLPNDFGTYYEQAIGKLRTLS